MPDNNGVGNYDYGFTYDGGGGNSWLGNPLNPPKNPTFDPRQQWKDAIAELQRRLAYGQYDSGQFYEFQQKIKSYESLIRDYERTNKLGQYENLGLQDPTKFFDERFLNQRYDIGRGNLARAQGGAVSGAQRSAGAIAGAQGLLNAAGFITGAGSQARQPYASAFGELEQGRAGALQQNQMGLYNALTQKAQIEEQFRQNQIGNDFAKQQWLANMQQYQDQYENSKTNVGDWLPGLLTGAATIINPFLGMATGAITNAGFNMSRPSTIKNYTPPPLTSYDPYKTLGRR